MEQLQFARFNGNNVVPFGDVLTTDSDLARPPILTPVILRQSLMHESGPHSRPRLWDRAASGCSAGPRPTNTALWPRVDRRVGRTPR